MVRWLYVVVVRNVNGVSCVGCVYIIDIAISITGSGVVGVVKCL